MNIELLDSIYERYGYEVKKSHVGVRVYIFTKSIYSGAEIIVTDSQSCNIEQLRKEYSDSGYAVKVRQYKSIEEAEVILFKEFFKVDAVIQNLKRRYEDFIRRVMDKLSDSATYEYIKCPYEISKYQSENLDIPRGVYVDAVEEDSPAMTAGVQNADIVHALNGKEISSMNRYSAILQSLVKGSRVKLEVYRKNPYGTYVNVE